MNIKKVIYYIIGIIALLYILVQVYDKYKIYKHEYLNWKNNYYNLNNQIMNKKDFNEWSDKNNLQIIIDSLNKIIDRKIKIKNVTQYNEIVNKYKDTTIVIFNLDSLLNKDSIALINYNNGCWGFRASFNKANNTFKILEKSSTDTIYSIEYFVRKKILFLHIGKKQYYRKTWSNCNGEVKETLINVE